MYDFKCINIINKFLFFLFQVCMHGLPIGLIITIDERLHGQVWCIIFNPIFKNEIVMIATLEKARTIFYFPFF